MDVRYVPMFREVPPYRRAHHPGAERPPKYAQPPPSSYRGRGGRTWATTSRDRDEPTWNSPRSRTGLSASGDEVGGWGRRTGLGGLSLGMEEAGPWRGYDRATAADVKMTEDSMAALRNYYGKGGAVSSSEPRKKESIVRRSSRDERGKLLGFSGLGKEEESVALLLASLQQPDGSWLLSRRLEQQIPEVALPLEAIPDVEIQKLKRYASSTDELLWITLLVVGFIELCYYAGSEEKDIPTDISTARDKGVAWLEETLLNQQHFLFNRQPVDLDAWLTPVKVWLKNNRSSSMSFGVPALPIE